MLQRSCRCTIVMCDVDKVGRAMELLPRGCYVVSQLFYFAIGLYVQHKSTWIFIIICVYQKCIWTKFSYNVWGISYWCMSICVKCIIYKRSKGIAWWMCEHAWINKVFMKCMVNVLAPSWSGQVGHSLLCLEWIIQLGHKVNVYGFDLGSGDALVESSQ